MTDTTTAPEGYTKITWWDVRKGDVLLHANGDRLTVSERDSGVRVRVAGGEIGRMDAVWSSHGFTPYRKQPELPNEQGAYIDKDGVVWELVSSEPWSWSCGGDMKSTRYAARFAPFTRLVPMPSKVDVQEALLKSESLQDIGADADAVMALLGGGDDE